MTPSPGRRLASVLAAAAIVLVALAARFSTLDQVFTPLGLVFPETDPFYHARRILLALHHFPHVIQFDAYVNFPEGARIVWPVGFDLALAALGAAVGGLRDPDRAIRAVAIAIPFLALPGIAVTGLLARGVAGTLAGFCAAALLAILPQQVVYGLVGRVDHHVLEPYFLAVVLLVFLRAAAAPAGRARDGRAALCGALMALSFWFVTTAILIPAFLAAGLILARGLQAAGLSEDRRLGRPAAIAFAAAAVVLLPFVLTSTFGKAGEFTYVGLSWLQEAAVVLTGLVVAAVHWVLAPGRKLPRVALIAGTVLAGTVVALLAGIPEGQGLSGTISTLRDAEAFLMRRDTVVMTVGESQSPLHGGPIRVLRNFTPWVFLAPLLWIGLLREGRRDRFANTGMTLLLAIVPLAWILFLLQYRFGIMLGVPLAVLAGWAVDRAWRAVRTRNPRRALGLATLLVALLTPPLAAWALLPSGLQGLRGVSDPALTAYRWIRDHTPATRGFENPSERPEYGILSDWDQGHFLTWYAHRPNVANPFGQAPWHIRGAVRGSRILLHQDAGRAGAVCAALSIRYLVLQSTRSKILMTATVAGGEQNAFASEEKDETGSTVTRVLPPYFETLHARLSLFDGASIPVGGRMLPALDDFRLVYESPEAGGFPVFVRGASEPIVPRLVKIFERVRGASLEGMCEAGKPVEASVQVQTNAGRRFGYSTAAACGASGRFRMRVPYAQSVRGDTGALDAYVLRNGVRRTSVIVTESDVEEGRKILVGGWGA